MRSRVRRSLGWDEQTTHLVSGAMRDTVWRRVADETREPVMGELLWKVMDCIWRQIRDEGLRHE